MSGRSAERLDELLDELARRFARGDELDLPGLLAQAGEDADRFAELADRFLEASPRREPSPAALAYVKTLDEPPLLRLRLRRRMKVAAVSAMLAKSLAITDLARLEGYYQRLEGDLLDPDRVDARVWSALEGILRAPVRALAQPRRVDMPADTVFLRLAEPTVAASTPAPAELPSDVGLAADPAPTERDELDRLFLGDD